MIRMISFKTAVQHRSGTSACDIGQHSCARELQAAGDVSCGLAVAQSSMAVACIMHHIGLSDHLLIQQSAGNRR